MTIIERINQTRAASLFHNKPEAAVSVYLSEKDANDLIKNSNRILRNNAEEEVGLISEFDGIKIYDRSVIQMIPNILSDNINNSYMVSEVFGGIATTKLIDDDSKSQPELITTK